MEFELVPDLERVVVGVGVTAVMFSTAAASFHVLLVPSCAARDGLYSPAFGRGLFDQVCIDGYLKWSGLCDDNQRCYRCT